MKIKTNKRTEKIKPQNISEAYNSRRDTVLLVHGFRGSRSSEYVVNLKDSLVKNVRLTILFCFVLCFKHINIRVVKNNLKDSRECDSGRLGGRGKRIDIRLAKSGQ